MHNLIQKFKQSIAWYSVEALIYQSVLLSHQLFLYNTIGPEVYAQQSILFAGIYLLIDLANFGLDPSLMPFFTIWSRNKRACRYFFGYHFLPNYLILSGVLVYVYQTSTFTNSPYLFGSIALIVICESTKRTAKIIAQQLFKIRFVTAFEIASILLYIACVWSIYLLGYTLDLYALFIPMLLVSCITLSWYLILMFKWYNQLEESEEHAPHQALERRIIKSRIFTYAHTISQLMFSTNMLIPLLSISMPVEIIGTCALIAHTIQTITLILRKTITPSTGALFAHIKTMPMHAKYDIFHRITSIIYTLVYLCILFLLMHYRFIYLMVDRTYITFILFMSLYNLIHLCMIAYEKWYILNESMYILVSLIISIASILGIIFTFAPLTYMSMLIYIAIAHVCLYLLTFMITWKKWRLAPRFALNWPLFLSGICVLIIIYISSRIFLNSSHY